MRDGWAWDPGSPSLYIGTRIPRTRLAVMLHSLAERGTQAGGEVIPSLETRLAAVCHRLRRSDHHCPKRLACPARSICTLHRCGKGWGYLLRGFHSNAVV